MAILEVRLVPVAEPLYRRLVEMEAQLRLESRRVYADDLLSLIRGYEAEAVEQGEDGRD